MIFKASAFLFFGFYLSAFAAHVLPAQVPLPGGVSEIKPRLISPDGTFALASGLIGEEEAIFYVGLTKPKVIRLDLPAYQKILITNDGRHIYGFVPLDGMAVNSKRIELVGLDPAGKIISRRAVWDGEKSKTSLCFSCTFFAANGNLFFVEKIDDGARSRLSVFDLRRKKTKQLLDAETVFPYLPVSTVYRAEPYAGRNEWVGIYTAPCPPDKSCLQGTVYGLNVNSLTMRQLKIPDGAPEGLLNSLAVDERSNSPWMGVVRCAGPKGNHYSVYNVETDEQRTLFVDQGNRICSTHLDEAFVVRGDRLYWSDWFPNPTGKGVFGVYSFSTNELLPLRLVALSAGGEQGVFLNQEKKYILHDFPSGNESPAFQIPVGANGRPFGEERYSSLEWFQADGGFSWFTSPAEKVGENLFRISLWRATLGARTPATLAASIEGESSDANGFYPCALERRRNGMLCLTQTRVGKAQFLEIWKF